MKKIFSISILLIFLNAQNLFAADNFLNDLSCEKYIDKEDCASLYVFFKDRKIDNYYLITFDNQLRKITYLLHDGRDDIARKKYNYFFEVLEDTIEKDDQSELKNYKEKVWVLISNYSKSDDYTSNPNYKLN